MTFIEFIEFQTILNICCPANAFKMTNLMTESISEEMFKVNEHSIVFTRPKHIKFKCPIKDGVRCVPHMSKSACRFLFFRLGNQSYRGEKNGCKMWKVLKKMSIDYLYHRENGDWIYKNHLFPEDNINVKIWQ